MKAKTFKIELLPEKYHDDSYYMVTWQKTEDSCNSISVCLMGVFNLRDLLEEAGYTEVEAE